MKLSDAIEQGWSKYDQVYGPYFYPDKYIHTDWEKEYDPALTTAVCAIGAACIAVEPESMPDVAVVKRHWPELYDIPNPQTHPAMAEVRETWRNGWCVASFITELNDAKRWPKEEIIEQVRKWGL